MADKIKKQSNPDDAKFEKELHSALKFFGYQFPETSADIDRLDKLYGSTKVALPDHLKNPDEVMLRHKINTLPEINFGQEMNIAAFSSSEEPPSFNNLDFEPVRKRKRKR